MEGSIAEGYTFNKSLTSCSLYIDDVDTIFNRPNRSYDVGGAETLSSFSIFAHNGHGIIALTNVEINMDEAMKVNGML